MSITNRYAKPQPVSLDSETLKQVRMAGQKLAANGMTHNTALGQTGPTAAQYAPGSGGAGEVQKNLNVKAGDRPALSPDDGNRQAHTKDQAQQVGVGREVSQAGLALKESGVAHDTAARRFSGPAKTQGPPTHKPPSQSR